MGGDAPAIGSQPRECQRPELALLLDPHGKRRPLGSEHVAGMPGLHLDEDEIAAVDRHEVDLPANTLRPRIASHDPSTSPPESGGDQILAPLPGLLPRKGHGLNLGGADVRNARGKQ